MKLKVQDNLEFLQWCKRFWDLNAPEEYYDAVHRRRIRASRLGRTYKTLSTKSSVASGHSLGSVPHSEAGVVHLKRQNAEFVIRLQQLEKERDFYFGKLLNIEMLVQDLLDSLASRPFFEAQTTSVLHDIQTILYKQRYATSRKSKTLCHCHRKGLRFPRMTRECIESCGSYFHFYWYNSSLNGGGPSK